MSTNISQILSFLSRLEDVKIHYSLARYREDAIMVIVAVPGERWEIEFMIDGSIDIEIFHSDGILYNASKLEELFSLHSN